MSIAKHILLTKQCPSSNTRIFAIYILVRYSLLTSKLIHQHFLPGQSLIAPRQTETRRWVACIHAYDWACCKLCAKQLFSFWFHFINQTDVIPKNVVLMSKFSNSLFQSLKVAEACNLKWRWEIVLQMDEVHTQNTLQ